MVDLQVRQIVCTQDTTVVEEDVPWNLQVAIGVES